MLGVRRELWESAMQKNGYYIMTISSLEQLYLDTTSKEDLLAEINDQRRQVIDARGLAAELERKLWAVEKERDALIAVKDECNELIIKNNRLRSLLSKHRRKYSIKPKTAVGAEIITLMEQGLRNKEIIDKGFNKFTVENIRKTIKKAAQSI